MFPVTMLQSQFIEDNEEHEVAFGNVRLVDITACKFDDSNANGFKDPCELMVHGFPFILEGTNVKGEPVNLEAETDETGCVTFSGLLPGSYTICENLSLVEGWVAITDECVEVVLPDGEVYERTVEFGNIRPGSITACKFYDADQSGTRGDIGNEPPMAGILFTLEGTDILETPISLQNCTDDLAV